jgi:hypothetical protein
MDISGCKQRRQTECRYDYEQIGPEDATTFHNIAFQRVPDIAFRYWPAIRLRRIDAGAGP